MTSKPLHNTARILVCVGLVLTLVGTGVPSVASADTPQTADEYFETFRSMEGTPAYQNYGEFETIRTFAITRAQEVGTLDTNERREMAALLTVLQTFSQSYQSSQSGNYDEALSQANDVEDAVGSLEETGAQTEASLAQLGLTRYYETIASEAQTQAESTQRTPEEIELLTVAATAYKRAGLPDQAAQFTAQVEQMETEYKFATEDMESATTEAQSYLSTCANCGGVARALISNPVALFSQYQRVQSLRSEVGEAVSKAEIHGVTESHQELSQTNEQVNNSWMTLAISSSLLLVMYGLVIAVISVFVVTKLFSWKQDFENVEVSNVVAVGDTNV